MQVGLTTSTSADILSGISDGDRVVVDGTDRLVEGATVRVRKAGELDNPPGSTPPAAARRREAAADRGAVTAAGETATGNAANGPSGGSVK